MMHSLAWWPTVAALLIATIADLRSGRIPNWLVFPFMLAGIAVSIYVRGWAGAGNSLRGIALGILLCGVLVYLKALGMGDVKLCAAIGAWIGPEQLFTALILTGLAGGLIALIWSLCRGYGKEAIQNSRRLLIHLGRRGIQPHPELALGNPASRAMPYAPAIAVGTLLSFFAGSI